MKKWVAGFVLTLCTAPAWADSKTGNDLYEACSKPEPPETVDNAAGRIACGNYVSGALDGFRMTKEGQTLLTLPPEVSGVQAQDVVLKYLKDHPEQRHLPAAFLVISALLKAFPR